MYSASVDDRAGTDCSPFPAQLESTWTAKLSSTTDPPRARAWPIVPLSAPTADWYSTRSRNRLLEEPLFVRPLCPDPS
ncbi:hypothetical protein SeMB42_g04646 [Synchytrium endobioticum]|uniref:Uncharacterized protein n=1 Tax=Synchytrium endobioticum TaxID=286115 RepID=A0A507CWU3_9FUNG|nr:hypothetical protein SeMB42_g04646 [Synchytrium endobioticum]